MDASCSFRFQKIIVRTTSPKFTTQRNTTATCTMYKKKTTQIRNELDSFHGKSESDKATCQTTWKREGELLAAYPVALGSSRTALHPSAYTSAQVQVSDHNNSGITLTSAQVKYWHRWPLPSSPFSLSHLVGRDDEVKVNTVSRVAVPHHKEQLRHKRQH